MKNVYDENGVVNYDKWWHNDGELEGDCDKMSLMVMREMRLMRMIVDV